MRPRLQNFPLKASRAANVELKLIRNGHIGKTERTGRRSWFLEEGREREMTCRRGESEETVLHKQRYYRYY